MNNHRPHISGGQRERVFALTAGACYYCGCAATDIDHIVPRSYVANDTDDNLVPACRICNGIASNKHFPNLQAKKEYILGKRKTPHWRRWLARLAVIVVKPVGTVGRPPREPDPEPEPVPEPEPRHPLRRSNPVALNVSDFHPIELTKGVTGPMAVRKLLGLTAAQMGSLLGGYKRQTIYTWERPERGERLPARYAMTAKARERYRALLTELVTLASGGRLQLYAILGPRRWGFALRGKCRECGRPFVVRRRGAVRCKRCINRRKR